MEFNIHLEAPNIIHRGVIHVEAQPKSLFAQWFETLSALLIWESGF